MERFLLMTFCWLIYRFNPVRFELIQQSALKTRGGLSSLDYDEWRRILTSNSFETEASDLWSSIAKLTRTLCSAAQEENSLEPLLASCLILLNKNPDLRPIGIGETLRRIIGKSVDRVLKQDIVDALAHCKCVLAKMQAVKLPSTHSLSTWSIRKRSSTA